MYTRKISSFQKVHTFTFTYGKQAGKRNLDVDVAIPLWQILFKNEVRSTIKLSDKAARFVPVPPKTEQFFNELS